MSSTSPAAANVSSPKHTALVSAFLSGFFLLVCALLTLNTVAKAPYAPFRMAEPGWVSMPPGARSAYLGIHGGTVPVSLLVNSTGTSLISFVGQTGNDFLALLRKAEMGLPSILNNSTILQGSKFADLLAHPETAGRKIVSAGTSHASLPVISLSDDSVFSLTAKPGAVQPFGFSEQPASVEGTARQPEAVPQQPRYHILVEPQHLMPGQTAPQQQ